MSLLRLEEWPVHFRMGADGLAAWRSLSAMLRRELDQPILDELSAAMARELILCLMLGISRSAAGHPSAPTAQATLIRRLRRALAECHARPSVALLARSVGVSTSTLARVPAGESPDRRRVEAVQIYEGRLRAFLHDPGAYHSQWRVPLDLGPR